MKKNHENEFRGSKNGGREAWVGLEWPKNGEIRPPKVAAAAAVAFAGPIWAHSAAVRRDFWPARSPHLALPPWLERVQGWWLELSPTAKTRLV